MWADCFLPEFVNAKLGEFPSDLFVEIPSVIQLGLNRRHIIDVKVEAVIGGINGLRELVIGWRQGAGRVVERFSVRVYGIWERRCVFMAFER